MVIGQKETLFLKEDTVHKICSHQYFWINVTVLFPSLSDLGSDFQEYLKNVTFHYKDELVLFDANGDPPGHYDIMNFQRVGSLLIFVTI